MRCPACGATNPEGAQWCGQCYRRFDEPAAREAPPAPEPAQTSSPLAPATPAAPESPATDAAVPGFRRTGEEVQWECPQCGMFNDLTLTNCAVCGTSFVDRFRTETPPPPQNWSTALLLSVIAPGAGHISVGRSGTGFARLLLFVGWVAGALMLASSGGGRSLVVATPLILGAIFVWAITLVDVYRLSQDDNEILTGRTLLWLVVGVLLLLGISLVASVGGAPPTPPAP